MSEIWNQSLDEFLAQTASYAPTPGGGSVSVVTGSLGLGLIVMALEVVAKRGENSGVMPYLKQARDTLEKLRIYADRDVEAYEQVVSAMRLPKISEEEIEARKKVMSEAAVNGCLVPIEAGRLMLEGLKVGNESKDKISGHIVNDIIAGMRLLSTSMEICLANVDTNVSYIADKARAEEFVKEKENLFARSRELAP